MDINNTFTDGHPLPLLIFKDKKFILDPDAEKILRRPEYKSIGIIALVGKYRTGKSFLLNRVILNRKDQGFGVGPTIKPCTKGIWMWSEPILIENNHSKEKFPVFVIDTEGLAAYDEELNHDSRIFLISVLISSLFVLNSFGVIDETSISSLSFILNLSKMIKLNINSNENTAEFSKYFPSLLWLLRDFSLKLEDTEGNTITAKQYLDNALKQQTGCSEQIEEKNRLRRLICSYFTERDCFTLIRPVENENDLQNIQTIDESNFRKEFLEQASTFRNKVFKKVKPKVFNGKNLTGEMLVHLLNSIIDSINNGCIPVLENTWKYVCENECLKIFNDITNAFKVAIRRFKEENKENLKFFSEFEIYQKTLIKESLEKFKSNAIGNEQTDFEDKLRNSFTAEIKKFNEENCRFYEMTLNDTLEKNNKIIMENFEKDKYSKNYYNFFHDLETLKENTEALTPDFPLKKELLFSKMIIIIKRFIEITFVKNKLLNEKEILHLKNDLTHMTNKYKIKCEEHENLKNEQQNQIEKLNTINNELKNKENLNVEIHRKLETEKKTLQNRSEKDIFSVKKDFEIKIEKLNTEILKLQHEIKLRDDQINGINFSNEKLNSLSNEKIEFLETDIKNLKLRAEQIKLENDNLKAINADHEEKIDAFREEVNKKKVLEFELEKLNKQKNNSIKKSEDQESKVKSHLDFIKNQLESTKKNYEDILKSLRKNIGNPDAMAKILSSTENINLGLEPSNNTNTTKPFDGQLLIVNNSSIFNKLNPPNIVNTNIEKEKTSEIDDLIQGGEDKIDLNILVPDTVVMEKEVLKCTGVEGEKEFIDNTNIVDVNNQQNDAPKPKRIIKVKKTHGTNPIDEEVKSDTNILGESSQQILKANKPKKNKINEERDNSIDSKTVNTKKSQNNQIVQPQSPKGIGNSNSYNNNLHNLHSNQSNSNIFLNNSMTSNNLAHGSGNYNEMIESNKILTQSLNTFESRCHKLEEKVTKLKNINKLIKQSGGIQCKHCNKFFSIEEYEGHIQSCSTENIQEYHRTQERIQFKIGKGLMKRDELGKPYIEYQIEINFKQNYWTINRKFNQFSNLNKQLKSNFPDMHFPNSSKLFSKISDSSNNFHENKITLLENYLKDISEIYEIKTCKIFKVFFGLEDYSDHTDLELNVEEKSSRKGFFQVNMNLSKKNENFTEEAEKKLTDNKFKDGSEKSIKSNIELGFPKNSEQALNKRKNKNLSFS